MSYFRKNIDEMTGYTPGEQLGKGYIKLNTNENPYPPSPGVIEAIRAEANDSLKLYPAPFADALREKAADSFNLSPENVMVGNGSDDLLTIAVRAFVGEGETIAYPWPSYILYPTLCRIQDAARLEVPFPSDYSLPEGLFGTDARLTFVNNPNSPTGTFVPVADVEQFASQTSGVVLVDEAYVDFAEEDCLSLVSKHENVLVLRTFSKSFSLAGVRIGLAFSTPEIIQGMMKVKDSYNADRLSIAAGAAALDDMEHMTTNAAKIVTDRVKLTAELQARGFEVLPSQANFVMARPPAPPARELYEQLKERKILVRYFDEPSVSDYVRITVGTPEQIAALLGAIDEIA
ncbi:histidinol-phosphate transaminase [Planctomycetota bacterium]